MLARVYTAIAAILISSISSWAHTPYFTQTEKIALPGGEIGEIRLIHGDGILAVDPVRAIIFNSQGKVLARTHQTVPMAIVCAADRRCHAFDFKTNTVLEPDPITFGDRFVVYDTWNLEAGPESWGFAARPATFSEIADANLVLAKDHKSHFLIPFVIAAALIAVAFGRLLYPPSFGRFRWLRWVLVRVLRLAIAAVLLVFSLFWVWLSGMTDDQWLTASVAGSLAMLAAMFLFHRLRPKPSAT